MAAGMPALPEVGGQALIEGVMMRSPSSFTVVCRRPDGTLRVEQARWRTLGRESAALRWPVVRGVRALGESLLNGLAALRFSARIQTPGSGRAELAPGGVPFAPLATRLALVAVFLIGLPHLATWLLGLDVARPGFHLVGGAVQLALVVGYLASLARLPDVRRVFEYHGAEHKAVVTYERGLPLTVESARPQPRRHPRCGTSFVVLVIAVSCALFAVLLGRPLAASAPLDHALKLGLKLALLGPAAGLAYELVRLAGRRGAPGLLDRVVAWPGLQLQRITTREPDDAQLEVALLSLRTTLGQVQAA